MGLGLERVRVKIQKSEMRPGPPKYNFAATVGWACRSCVVKIKLENQNATCNKLRVSALNISVCKAGCHPHPYRATVFCSVCVADPC